MCVSIPLVKSFFASGCITYNMTELLEQKQTVSRIHMWLSQFSIQVFTTVGYVGFSQVSQQQTFRTMHRHFAQPRMLRNMLTSVCFVCFPLLFSHLQLMSALSTVCVTTLYRLASWWRKGDLILFADLIDAVRTHTLSGEMVSAANSRMKSVIERAKKENKALGDEHRDRIVATFVHSCIIAKSDTAVKASAVHQAHMMAQNYDFDKKGVAHKRSRSEASDEPTEAAESTESPQQDAMDVQMAEPPADEASEAALKVDTDASPQRPIKKPKQGISDAQIEGTSKFIAMKKLMEELTKERDDLQRKSTSDDMVISSWKEARRTAKLNELTAQRSASLASLSTFNDDIKPLVDDDVQYQHQHQPQHQHPASHPAVADMWLDSLTPFPEAQQGRLGIVGVAELSRRSSPAVPSAVAAAAKKVKSAATRHLVMFKKSYVLLDSVESYYAELAVMEAIRRYPHPNVHGVFGLAKTREASGVVLGHYKVGEAYAIELIRGVTLYELLKTNTTTHKYKEDKDMIASVDLADISSILTMMLQALLGTQHLHKIGVVHRDIHLSNIMVTGTELSSFCPHDKDFTTDELKGDYTVLDGYSSTPVVNLSSIGLPNDCRMTGDRGCRLALIDMNSALPVHMALRKDVRSELDAQWDCGAANYSLLSYEAKRASPKHPVDDVPGWENTTMRSSMEEHWIARDCFSLALVMCDIMRGYPMMIAPNNDEPFKIHSELQRHYFEYCATRLSPNHISNGIVVPSVFEYMYKQTMNREHWEGSKNSTSEFIVKNNAWRTLLEQPQYMKIKTSLCQMTSIGWRRLKPSPAVQHDAAIDGVIALHDQVKPSTFIPTLEAAIRDAIEHHRRLKHDFPAMIVEKLRSYGLVRAPMAMLGDCLYLSVIHQMNQYEEAGASADASLEGLPSSSLEGAERASSPAECVWRNDARGNIKYIDPSPESIMKNVQTMRNIIHAQVSLWFKQKFPLPLPKKSKGKARVVTAVPPETPADPSGDTPPEHVDSLKSVQDAWLHTAGHTPERRTEQLYQIVTMGQWNNEMGDNIAHTISMLYKVKIIIINATPTSYSSPDTVVGFEGWPVLRVLKTADHFDGTDPIVIH